MQSLPKIAVWACLLFSATAAVAFGQGGAASGTNGGSDQAAQPIAASDQASGAQYIIGPGDTIKVFVWRNPDLSVSVPVRPDGKISTPLIDDMVAVGKTPLQLAHDMESLLAEYLKDPKVNIIVEGAQSVFSQVKVIGQVKNPKSIPYHAGMTVLDAVLAVGGLTDFASGNHARLIRKDARGKETETRVRLKDLVEKGRVADNVLLKPGDILVVPEAWF